MADDDRPVIWYSAAARRWWMEPADPLVAAAIVTEHEDAIHVTNAYEVLGPAVVEILAREAGR